MMDINSEWLLPEFSEFHTALLDVVGVINNPQLDLVMIRETGLSLDASLFPLIVLIDKYAPVSLIEIANRLNRDSIVTRRQILKLEKLGYVKADCQLKRKSAKSFTITESGERIIAKIDYTRNYIYSVVFSGWGTERIVSFISDLKHLKDKIQQFDCRR